MASAEDILISKVCLAGWRIEQTRPENDYRNCSLFSPQGNLYGFFWTRYTAALAAEAEIWSDERGALPDAARAISTIRRINALYADERGALPDAAEAFGGAKTFRLPPR